MCASRASIAHNNFGSGSTFDVHVSTLHGREDNYGDGCIALVVFDGRDERAFYFNGSLVFNVSLELGHVGWASLTCEVVCYNVDDILSQQVRKHFLMTRVHGWLVQF